MENLNKILLILILTLTSCTVAYTPHDHYSYDDHPHTTEIYYHGVDIYFGYHAGFYYYYGVPHFYPWWYYYQFLPSYHYYAHTHIHVHCSNGHYVHHGHRNNRFNNKKSGNYKASTSIKTDKIKTNTFPREWKSSNSTRINKQNNTSNKINIKPNNRIINNKSNKLNFNKKYNINKGNNGFTRPNKTKTSRKKRK